MVIVIADDEAAIAALVATVAEDAGHTVVLAADGQAALEVVRAQWPALLITDLMMPRMTGAELIAALRAHAVERAFAPLPVILMTAARLRGTDMGGADAVLLKPFDLATLEALLTRFLGDGA